MLIASNSSPMYQVGGSLPVNASTYVRRKADEALFQGLQRGEFCYVFNARQMGKSSLRVQTTHRLQSIGIRCGVVDVTTIGTHDITPEQWYASIAGLLTKTFRLDINLLRWWHDRPHLSFINRLSEFLDTVLLTQVSEPIVIFIDEIDSVLNLPFSTDDFFALIRACYNQRAEHPAYRRLTFALFGVATPTDLVSDTTRTPFNIGQAIELRGFQFSECAPLLAGLRPLLPNADAALHRILYWTGGQPFLTQKVCQLVVQHDDGREHWDDGELEPDAAESIPFLPPSSNSPTHLIDRLIHSHILRNWESLDEPEHLKTIRNRLLYNEQKAGRLLSLYLQLLTHTEQQFPALLSNDSPEQMDLVLTGLVEKRQGQLQIKTLIYQQVFNAAWVTQQLASLRPYSQSVALWVASNGQDESRLLRGQALKDALNWAQNKSLSDLDYRFLAVSQEYDRQENQRILEAERLKEVEARLHLEQQRSLEQGRHLRWQRIMLGVISLMMLGAIALGILTYHQYQQTAISELRAIALSSDALFASNKGFDALLQAIKAKERLQNVSQVEPDLQTAVDAALWRAVLSIQEFNRLDGHTAAVLAVDFSPDGTQIATAGVDGTVKLWQADGKLIKTLQGHQGVVRSVKFSPDGTLLASAGDDTIIRLWQRDGTLSKTLKTHTTGLWSIAFSPDSSTLISGGTNSSVELWSRDGQWLKTFDGKPSGVRVVAFSPDGQTIAAGNSDTTITLWNRDGSQRQVLQGHTATVQAIAFSPDGRTLVTGSTDRTIDLWNLDGRLIKSIQGHDTSIWGLAFSPDGKMFASAGRDKRVKLWTPDGTLLTTLQGHTAAIWGVAFSPDGQTLVSAGAENVAILWKTHSAFQRTIHGVVGFTVKLLFNTDGSIIATAGNDKTISLWNFDGTPRNTINAHEASTSRLDLSPDGSTLASVSEDKTLKLWSLDGTLLRVFKDATAALISVTWHPDGTRIAASGADGTIWIWKTDGTLLKTIKAHSAPIWDIKFSPDGQRLASASNDKTVRLWTADGVLLKTLIGHQAVVWQLAFSPDSQQLASGSGDATIKLWTREGNLYKTLTGHKAATWGIAFSPDGSLLATANIDETVKLWTPDGVSLATLEGHRSGVRAIAFHPQHPILASAGDDQTIMLWNLDQILKLDPLTYACDWIHDYLTTNKSVKPDDAALCAASR